MDVVDGGLDKSSPYNSMRYSSITVNKPNETRNKTTPRYKERCKLSAFPIFVGIKRVRD